MVDQWTLADIVKFLDDATKYEYAFSELITGKWKENHRGRSEALNAVKQMLSGEVSEGSARDYLMMHDIPPEKEAEIKFHLSVFDAILSKWEQPKPCTPECRPYPESE